MTTMELIERGIGHNCLSDAYELGRADAYDEMISKCNKYSYIVNSSEFAKLLQEWKEQKDDKHS